MTRLFRLSLILLLVLALSAVSVASAQTGPSTNTITAPNDTYSLQVPSGWVSQQVDVINFVDSTAFASDPATLQASINFLVNGLTIESFQGIGGVIGVINPAQVGNQPLDPLVDPVLQSLTNLLMTAGAQTVDQTQPVNFGGLYPGELAQTSFGMVAVMHNDESLLVAVVLTDDVAGNSTDMADILDSIRIPAGASAPATPEATAVPATPEPVPSEEATPVAPAASLTVRSSDLRASLVIPGDWTLLDHVAEQNILAYGNSAAAAESRLHSAKPDLAPDTPITGNGGLVILYAMSQFSIDPANPDFSALMERALAGLTGYTVEQAPAPLDGSDGGLVAVISGAETGYLALIPFGDQFAYITATSATPNAFELDETLLLDIVESVRVPAELEPTPVPTSAGLGGLGGLGGLADVTPEPTAEGLGGL